MPDKALINEVERPSLCHPHAVPEVRALFGHWTMSLIIIDQRCRYCSPSLDINNLPLLIFVNKGIEGGTHALTLEIIATRADRTLPKVATFIVSLASLSSQLCFVLEPL